MDRRKFIQITGLTSLGLFLGFDALGSTSASGSIISIGEPIIHGRHGLFNLTDTLLEKGITIQRDILTRDGIDILSKDRITTLKISHRNNEVFHVFDQHTVDLKKGNLSVMKLTKDKPYTLMPHTEERIIFSECEDFSINHVSIKSTEGYICQSKEKQVIRSEKEQFVMVYNV